MFNTTLAEKLEARKRRAAELLEIDGAITPTHTPRLYIVQSQADASRHYMVDLNCLSCQCEDFRFNGLGTCKHRLACHMLEAERAAILAAQERNVSIRQLLKDLLPDLLEAPCRREERRILWLIEACERITARRERPTLAQIPERAALEVEA